MIEVDGQILRAYIVDSVIVRLRGTDDDDVVEIWTDDRPEWRPL